MKRPRVRKWAKWACTLAAGAAVVLAVSSRFWECKYVAGEPRRGPMWQVRVGQGVFSIVQLGRGQYLAGVPALGWSIGPNTRWVWWFADQRDRQTGFSYWADDVNWRVDVSLLYPVLLTTIPAALLWYADRRRFGPHQCKRCGYDRASLAADAKCPECGVASAK